MSIQGIMSAGDIATAAQKQYFSRPADQKFDSLDALLTKVQNRRNTAVQFESEIVDMKASVDASGNLLFSAKPKEQKLIQEMTPTHYAFGQTCSIVKAPAAFLRTLSQQGRPDLTVDTLNHCISKREAAGFKFLAAPDANDDGDMTLYSTTSPSYGRIWDADVVEATKTVLDRVNHDAGREVFFSPWAWGKKHRALFASQQDIFMYFIDGGSIVDGGGERDALHRGVYIWNSEVGAATFGVATFLFRATCGNFLVWGVENAKVLNIRHSSGGPDRFREQAAPALLEFAQSSVKQLEEGVHAAKVFALDTDKDKVLEFAAKHGFTRAEAKRAYDTAIAEEGQCATLWDLVNGFTACARMMAFADAKVDLETRAGKLMKIAAPKIAA